MVKVHFKGEIPLVITKRLSPQIPADIRQYKTTKSGRGSLLRIPARFGFRVVLKKQNY